MSVDRIFDRFPHMGRFFEVKKDGAKYKVIWDTKGRALAQTAWFSAIGFVIGVGNSIMSLAPDGVENFFWAWWIGLTVLGAVLGQWPHTALVVDPESRTISVKSSGAGMVTYRFSQIQCCDVTNDKEYVYLKVDDYVVPTSMRGSASWSTQPMRDGITEMYKIAVLITDILNDSRKYHPGPAAAKPGRSMVLVLK